MDKSIVFNFSKPLTNRQEILFISIIKSTIEAARDKLQLIINTPSKIPFVNKAAAKVLTDHLKIINDNIYDLIKLSKSNKETYILSFNTQMLKINTGVQTVDIYKRFSKRFVNSRDKITKKLGMKKEDLEIFCWSED